MITNYRGQTITYEALFEVLMDYLEGRREYSIEEVCGEDGLTCRCVYRKDYNAKSPVACLVGSFIADEKYDSDIEDCTFIVLDSTIYTLEKDLSPATVTQFQRVHDLLAAKHQNNIAKQVFNCLGLAKDVKEKYASSINSINKLLDQLISSTN